MRNETAKACGFRVALQWGERKKCGQHVGIPTVQCSTLTEALQQDNG